MTTWVLILTLAGVGASGVAIEHIGGFVSKQECLSAGNAWLNNKPSSYHRGSAACVQQTTSK